MYTGEACDVMDFSVHASAKEFHYSIAVLHIKITSIIDSPVYTCPLLDLVAKAI